MSLRLRLFGLTVALFAVGLVVAGTLVPRLVRAELIDRLDQQLRAVQQVAFLAELTEGQSLPGPIPVEEAAGLYLRSETGPGDTRFDGFINQDSADRSPPKLPDPVSSRAGQAFEVMSQDGVTRFRVYVGSRTSTGQFLAVALPTAGIDATVRRITQVELAVGTTLLVLVSVGTWWVVGVGLRPLRRMENQAESIAHRDWHAGGPLPVVAHPSTRTEIGRLGATLNHLLATIDEAFALQSATQWRLRRFVADASHELRTPLTSIRGYAELYRRHGGGDGPGDAAVARIEQESTRMSRLVGDLLMLARFDEAPSLDLADVDVDEVVREVVSDTSVVEPTRLWGVGIPTGTRVRADRARLGQALLNLLANIRSHTPPGTPAEVNARRRGEWIDIAVVDHGPGLPPDTADRVFERFWRADASRHRVGSDGAGLGLGIVAAIVAAHGGRVWADATPGGGATFTMSFPIEGPTATSHDSSTSFQRAGRTVPT